MCSNTLPQCPQAACSPGVLVSAPGSRAGHPPAPIAPKLRLHLRLRPPPLIFPSRLHLLSLPLILVLIPRVRRVLLSFKCRPTLILTIAPSERDPVHLVVVLHAVLDVAVVPTAALAAVTIIVAVIVVHDLR